MKKEAKTDLWISKLLDKANITYDPQGSSIQEIDEALKTASKNGKGNVGFPDFVAVVKDFIIVIEDKADISMHQNRDNQRLITD